MKDLKRDTLDRLRDLTSELMVEARKAGNAGDTERQAEAERIRALIWLAVEEIDPGLEFSSTL